MTASVSHIRLARLRRQRCVQTIDVTQLDSRARHFEAPVLPERCVPELNADALPWPAVLVCLGVGGTALCFGFFVGHLIVSAIWG